jgi:hypothetical protein
MGNATIFMSHVAVSGYFGPSKLPTTVAASWHSIAVWMLGLTGAALRNADTNLHF